MSLSCPDARGYKATNERRLILVHRENNLPLGRVFPKRKNMRDEAMPGLTAGIRRTQFNASRSAK